MKLKENIWVENRKWKYCVDKKKRRSSLLYSINLQKATRNQEQSWQFSQYILMKNTKIFSLVKVTYYILKKASRWKLNKIMLGELRRAGL